ncbi:hypothetical protein Hamer_G008198 [Homarus americanus]|uniref:Uncharacterized protein n=1 Tax=Homarus americanus TaxID=6706 RepID=A0A8J5ND15_HOMAM|nr:hypothetical protein Hamer_G008198 [Homarus americanus]
MSDQKDFISDKCDLQNLKASDMDISVTVEMADDCKSDEESGPPSSRRYPLASTSVPASRGVTPASAKRRPPYTAKGRNSPQAANIHNCIKNEAFGSPGSCANTDNRTLWVVWKDERMISNSRMLCKKDCPWVMVRFGCKCERCIFQVLTNTFQAKSCAFFTIWSRFCVLETIVEKLSNVGLEIHKKCNKYKREEGHITVAMKRGSLEVYQDLSAKRPRKMEWPRTKIFLEDLRLTYCNGVRPTAVIMENMVMKTPAITGSGMVTNTAPSLLNTPETMSMTALNCTTRRLPTYRIHGKL